MKRRFMFETTNREVFAKALGYIAELAKVYGEDEMDLTIAGEVPADQSRAKVRYRAIAGNDALKALGNRTVIGTLFAHLLSEGPCTVPDLRTKFNYTDKSVQSGLQKLRTMALVESEEIPA